MVADLNLLTLRCQQRYPAEIGLFVKFSLSAPVPQRCCSPCDRCHCGRLRLCPFVDVSLRFVSTCLRSYGLSDSACWLCPLSRRGGPLPGCSYASAAILNGSNVDDCTCASGPSMTHLILVSAVEFWFCILFQFPFLACAVDAL